MIRKPIIIILIFLVVGCSKWNPESTIIIPSITTEGNIKTPTVTIDQEYRLTPIGVETRTPTPSISVIFPTNSAKPTNAIPNGLSIELKCIDLISDSKDKLGINGKIVVIDEYNRKIEILDIASGVKNNLSQDENMLLMGGDVSPDKTRLLYEEYSVENRKTRIIIADERGNIIKYILKDPNWFSISGWLDNDWIWITTKGDPKNRLLLYNLTTDEKKPISTDFPGIKYADPNYLDWGNSTYSAVVYNPTLSMAIYPNGNPQESTIVLKDILKNEIVSEIPTKGFYNANPQWSPDGEEFLTTIDVSNDGDLQGDEIYVIKKDGKQQRVTNLTSIFKDVSIFFPIWSPDGKKIAFNVILKPINYPTKYSSLNSEESPRLAILDLDTRMVTLFCTPGNSYLSPIWSPDSRNLALSYLTNDPDKGFVYIVDTLKGTATFINNEKLFPVGWLEQ